MGRFIQFLIESRSNRHLNKKESAQYALERIYKEHKGENLYANFTDMEKIGVNPKAFYETPMGIYAYPLEYVVDTGIKYLEYAGDRKYINVFKIKDDANVVNLNTVNFIDYYDKIVDAYMKLYNVTNRKEAEKSIKKVIKEKTKSSKNGGDVLLKVTNKLSKYKPTYFETAQWNKFLRELGIDAIYDSGKGIIHYNEPIQIAVLNPKVIQMIERVVNKDYEQNEKGQEEYHKNLAKRFYDADMEEKRKLAIIYPYDVVRLRYLPEEIIEYFINYDPYTISEMKAKIPEYLLFKAVRLAPAVIQYVKNPSEKLLITAIKEDPEVIKLIKKPSRDLIKMAIEEYPYVILSLKNVDEDLFDYAKSLAKERNNGVKKL